VDSGQHALAALRRVPLFEMKVSDGLWLMNKAALLQLELFNKSNALSWALTLAHDPEGKIPELLQPPKMPTSYIIDREGIIRYVNYGFVPGDAPTIERRLTELAAAEGGGRPAGKHH